MATNSPHLPVESTDRVKPSIAIDREDTLQSAAPEIPKPGLSNVDTTTSDKQITEAAATVLEETIDDSAAIDEIIEAPPKPPSEISGNHPEIIEEENDSKIATAISTMNTAISDVTRTAESIQAASEPLTTTNNAIEEPSTDAATMQFSSTTSVNAQDSTSVSTTPASPVNSTDTPPSPVQPPEHFYIATLAPNKKNSALLTRHGHIKASKTRNADYTIMPATRWEQVKHEYDTEIPAHDVHCLYISFQCHGESHKSIYVHGSEKVFDAVMALFVNKTFGLSAFNRLFIVTWRGKPIDPTVNFGWFGCERIELIVGRRPLNGLSDDAATPPRHGASPDLYVSPAESAPCVGLANLGNTCFMNSGIQCLNNCQGLVNFFLHHAARLIGARNPVLREWARLLVGLNSGGKASARGLKAAMGEAFPIYKSNDEQDSLEFITNLLDALHEALKVEFHIRRHSPANSGGGDQMSGNTTQFPEYTIEASSAATLSTAEAATRNREPGTSEISTNNGHALASSKIAMPSRAPATLPSDSADFWNSFLLHNNTPIITEFYGVLTTTIHCPGCSHQQVKHDLFASLALPIPPANQATPAVALIFEGPKPPLRARIPSEITVAELGAFLARHYGASQPLLVMEYGRAPLQMLPPHAALSAVSGRVCCYEYTPGHQYFLCSILFKRLFFFRERLPVDFLVRSCPHGALCGEATNTFVMCAENRRRLHAKLEPYFRVPLTPDELFKAFSMNDSSVNPVFRMPHVVLSVSRQSFLFGRNMEAVAAAAAVRPRAPSVTDCLADFLREAHVQAQCDACGAEGLCVMETRLSRMPRVLVIQLMRFAYTGRETKVDTLVDFPLESLEVEGVRYHLIATSHHIEIGMGYGHYVSYINKNGRWYCCNDAVISKSSGPEKKSAYVFFYELCSQAV